MNPVVSRFIHQSLNDLLDYAVTRLLAATSLDDLSLYLSALYRVGTLVADDQGVAAILSVIQTLTQHAGCIGNAVSGNQIFSNQKVFHPKDSITRNPGMENFVLNRIFAFLKICSLFRACT